MGSSIQSRVLTDQELRHWAIRCLKYAVQHIETDYQDYRDTEDNLREKVRYEAGMMGFHPTNCELIADRAMNL